MHLGKFHAIVNTLAVDFTDKSIQSQMEQIANQLDSIASNPGHTEVAKSFRALIDKIRTDLSSFELNRPSANERAILESIDALPFIGDALFQRIEDVIAENGMTPTLAATSLRELSVKTITFYSNIKAIEAGFSKLNVEYDDLDNGEGEIAIAIPEPDQDRTLADLAKVTKEWDKALRPFTELADPDHNPIVVRTISSTDWQFYLTSVPAVYLALSSAISHVNELLGKLVETRKLISQLKKSGISEEATAPIVAEADKSLDSGTRQLAENIVDEHAVADKGRSNELKTEVTASLRFLARQMASNVTIEVRYIAPELPVETDEDAGADDEANRKNIETLIQVSAQIERNMDLVLLDSHTNSILNLPAPEDE